MPSHRAHRLDSRSGVLTGGVLVTPEDQVMVVTDTGRVIRFGADTVSIYGRAARGVRIMRLEDGERIVDVAQLVDTEDGDADEDELDAVDGTPEDGAPEDGTPDDDAPDDDAPDDDA